MEASRKPHPLMRLSRIIAGSILVVAGVVGLALPILPGWLFIIPGLSLLSSEFVWAARLRRRAADEWSKLRASRSSEDDRAA